MRFRCGNGCSQRDIFAAIWLGAKAPAPELQEARLETDGALTAAAHWQARFRWAVDGWRTQLELDGAATETLRVAA